MQDNESGRTVLSARRGILRELARTMKYCNPVEQQDELGAPKKIKSSSTCDMCWTPNTDVGIHCKEIANS